MKIISLSVFFFSVPLWAAEPGLPAVTSPGTAVEASTTVPKTVPAENPAVQKASRNQELAELRQVLQSKQLPLERRTQLEKRVTELEEANRAELLNQNTSLGETPVKK